MNKLKTYYRFFENIGSPLLNLSDNVDSKLISLIQNEVKPPSKILEISCGNGSDSLRLQELGYEVVCTEYNKDYVINAQNLGLNCIEHDTKSKFPFSNKEFDLVYSRLGLHYFSIDELDYILKDLSRIGDKLLITVKLVNDIQTNKIILTEDIWENIINKYFNIKEFKVIEGILYDIPSKWLKILSISK